MEKDIKVVEEFINQLKEYEDEEEIRKAIENLIARNKKLEEKNKKLEDYILKYFDEIEKEYNGLINHKFIDYIPKSKIKEIIEDIDNNKPVIAELKLRKLEEGDK